MRRHRRPSRSGHRGQRTGGRTPGARTVRVFRNRLAPSGSRADPGASLPGARPGRWRHNGSGADSCHRGCTANGCTRRPGGCAARRHPGRRRGDAAWRRCPMSVTSIDVNLRSAPAEDAEVISILGQGVELEVTGPPVDGWVPVTEPSSGQTGFVSSQFVTLVT